MLLEGRKKKLQNEISNLEAEVIRVSPYIPKAANNSNEEDPVSSEEENEKQSMYLQLLTHLKKVQETHSQSRLDEETKIRHLAQALEDKEKKAVDISTAFRELRKAAGAKDVNKRILKEIAILEEQASKKLLEISQMRSTVLKLKLDANRKKARCSQETGQYVLGFEELQVQSKTMQKQTNDIENEIARLDDMYKSHVASISEIEQQLSHAVKVLDEKKTLLKDVGREMGRTQKKYDGLKKRHEAKKLAMTDRSRDSIQELESKYVETMAEKKALMEEIERLKARYESLTEPKVKAKEV